MTREERKQNERIIWYRLLADIPNPCGVAAIMGNLMAESSMNPKNITGKKAGEWTGDGYCDALNSGWYTPEEFAHDGIAFGLVQWAYWSRKRDLFLFARSHQWDIGSVECQTAYLLEELPKYKTVWSAVQNAQDIATACDLVMLKYEQPATVTDAAKEKRRKYAQGYYDTYFGTRPAPEPEIRKKVVVTTADKVLMRLGNGTDCNSYRRCEKKGTAFDFVAESENGWYGVRDGNRVLWISKAFARIEERLA